MSEFDPTAASRALDTILNRVHDLPNFGVGDPGSQLDGLHKSGQLTDEDVQTLRKILATIHAQPRPAASTVVAEIDVVLNGPPPIRPVMASILKTIRLMASLQAAEAGGQQPQTLLSIPQIDLAAASDGAVEGAGFGGLAGGEIGGPAGVLVGALVGGLVGGLIRGFGHGAEAGSGGSGGGSKKLAATQPAV